jgi:hypothetical protein
MTIGNRRYVRIVLIALFIVMVGSLAQAQRDPEKVLVGTWEGVVDGIRDNGRTIIIRSVKPSDKGWEGQGFYATSASKGKGERMTFEVSRQGDDINIEFVTSQKNPGKLKLIDDRHMEGTMNFVVSGGKRTNRTLKLEKVESK